MTVPISAEDLDRAKRQVREAIAAGAQMLELRMDYLDPLDAKSAAALIAEVREAGQGRVPAIVTCRDAKEGGARPHPDELRLRVLRAAVEAGADFIDVEYANFIRPEFGQGIRAAL
ncbi:MAG: type I 3-dehydroquinate dehydratase, partial [Phycisphaerales bacterium]